MPFEFQDTFFCGFSSAVIIGLIFYLLRQVRNLFKGGFGLMDRKLDTWPDSVQGDTTPRDIINQSCAFYVVIRALFYFFLIGVVLIVAWMVLTANF